jgi:flagellin
VQTAEGALTETHSILQRMRDLSVQASNSGSLSDDAKGNIQAEIVQLKAELNRIADTTTFNGKKLLDGSFNAAFQVGANAGETIAVNLDTVMDATGLGVAGVDVAAVAANAATGTVTNAVGGATPAAAEISLTFTGATDFSSATVANDFTKFNGTISYGGKSIDLSTVEYAATDTTNALRITRLNNAINDALGTTGVNLAVGTPNTTLEWTAPDAPAVNASAEAIAAVTPTFAQASGASEAIDLLDTAIQTVSTVRAEIGAIQNRFDHTVNNLNVAVENLTASESRIRDADMAQEMVSFTRHQILSQAGTAMLAQANQASQGVLQLLR